MNAKLALITERLRDERSRKVVFVAHCILNENARYQGGAFWRGAIDPIVDDLQRRGLGIVQMKCPECKAWGGVLRKWMWLPAIGIRGTLLYRMRGAVLRLFKAYTRARFRPLAREVAREIADLHRSGTEVAAIIGIRGSPSCGVTRTADFGAAIEYLAGVSASEVARGPLNDVFGRCIVEGRGFFIDAIVRALDRKGIAVPLLEHDFPAELAGKPTGSPFDPPA